jgi:hypothetical protein
VGAHRRVRQTRCKWLPASTSAEGEKKLRRASHVRAGHRRGSEAGAPPTHGFGSESDCSKPEHEPSTRPLAGRALSTCGSIPSLVRSGPRTYRLGGAPTGRRLDRRPQRGRLRGASAARKPLRSCPGDARACGVTSAPPTGRPFGARRCASPPAPGSVEGCGGSWRTQAAAEAPASRAHRRQRPLGVEADGDRSAALGRRGRQATAVLRDHSVARGRPVPVERNRREREMTSALFDPPRSKGERTDGPTGLEGRRPFSRRITACAASVAPRGREGSASWALGPNGARAGAPRSTLSCPARTGGW